MTNFHFHLEFIEFILKKLLFLSETVISISSVTSKKEPCLVMFRKSVNSLMRCGKLNTVQTFRLQSILTQFGFIWQNLSECRVINVFQRGALFGIIFLFRASLMDILKTKSLSGVQEFFWAIFSIFFIKFSFMLTCTG